ncbi:MAG: ribulose-phosphate 3-epimerase, partial [Candidatus Peregrinibacteria bacterium GW2011_GWE2_39_6]
PTEVKLIEPYLELVDQVLVMSVHPGFGGQAFIEDSLLKIKRLRELKSSLDICVDGGINLETAQKCLKAGANVLVVGSFLLRADNRQKIITELRELK